MKVTKFLFIILALYSLWLLRDIHKNGILHKERKTIEQTLIKSQHLIDQLKLSTNHADKILKGIQADYQVKTKDWSPLLQALHRLITTLRYGFFIIIGLASIGVLKYVLKS